MKTYGTNVEAGFSLPSSAILARGGNPRNIIDRQGQVFTVSTGTKKAVGLIDSHHVIVKPSWVQATSALPDAETAVESMVAAGVLTEGVVLATGANPNWGPVVRMTGLSAYDGDGAILIGHMSDGVFKAL